MDKPIHIGRLIKNELHKQGKTTIWLAEQCGCTRINLYKIYKRAWISTDMLYTISTVLKHNFFLDLSQDLAELEAQDSNNANNQSV
ncbi:MAG: XRE family transcriptional regulator [Paludibacteraceae bacterium]|nr:XRE family transcriptional regulator [Paludibacteraceae bacterium]